MTYSMTSFISVEKSEKQKFRLQSISPSGQSDKIKNEFSNSRSCVKNETTSKQINPGYNRQIGGSND